MKREEMNALLGVSEEELDKMARSFEEDTWNRSEYGSPSMGRPSIFGETMRPVTFKETPSTIAAIDERAASLGSTRSDYLRNLVAQDLALAV